MFFKKSKKSSEVRVSEIKKVVNPGKYPAKILLAWTKAIEGNQDILKWLNENGYQELAIATWAIQLDDKARGWLMDHGYPHLMAFIHAAEGNESARNWLQKHNFTVFLHMALAIDGELDSYFWLKNNCPPEIFILTKTIEKVKDEIEERHRDIHKFGDWN